MNNVYYSNDGSVNATIEGKANGGKTLFWVRYGVGCGLGGGYETHKIHLYEWAKHLHGNAPSGTPYGYFRATQNGKRVIITV